MEPLNGDDGDQEQPSKKEQPQKGSGGTPQHSWVAWWNGMTTGGIIYLFALSQILVSFQADIRSGIL